ncbi:hypothetical protein [Nocardioides piscis]|uniref:DUF3558 domain-containing protein n=1 Tax=Nocardioides piscis TaxID=2714938 RepID=A0A6G7YC61_9ACTN|nr:hypothetical protein [Nocardioides piscis]QIK74309.1 hypothetical protein G7071_01490 [Nocardioides piscis]
MNPSRPTTMLRPLTALAATLALTLTAACSTEEQMRGVDPAGQSADADDHGAPAAPDEMPSAIPAADGLVRTEGLVTVLDDGDGPQLCTFVAESLPPQCEGTPLAGWDWAAHPEHEDQSGTRWGDFALTGTFDGESLTVTDAIPAALYDTVSQPPEPSPTSPCDPPAGGWAVVDPAKADQASMDATFATAGGLPGYAGAWLDQGPDEAAANDPTKVVINVAVTQDPAGAEAKLRETWGGALCVSEARFTEAELNEVAMELQKLPGATTSSAADDVVQLGVLFDDGSLQAWADETYGEGRVEITSTLGPVG